MPTPVPVVSAVACALVFVSMGAALGATPIPTMPAPAAPVAPRPTDAPGDPRFEPGLLDMAAPAIAPLPVLIRFHERVPERLPDGLVATYRFATLPALLATATPAALAALGERGDLAYAEHVKALAPALDSTTRTSHARDVTDPGYRPETPPVYDAHGRPVDGRGVGVAVVDTGIDGTHPGLASQLAGNWIVTPSGVAPGGPFTAQTSHGTHVAGIVAGTGAASFQNGYRGVAPGAALHGFAVGGSLAFASIAFDWILAHGQDQEPPIRVVLNAWTCATVTCRVWDAMQLHNVLATQLADAGYVVVYAAGNDGGDGFTAMTSSAATNPTPGILSVGDYNDLDSGLRISCLYPGSSRGTASDPATWPDVAAPGRASMSPHAIEAAETTRVPGAEANGYTLFHGTSAAAAHAAGVVALLLQLRPDLSPHDVEFLLKQTATPLDCGMPYVRASSAHPWTPANFAAGHGLIDAHGAAMAAVAHTGLPNDAPPLEPVPEAWRWIRVGATPEAPRYLTADGRIVPAYPAGDAPGFVALDEEGFTFQTAPLQDEAVHAAAVVDLWVGTNWESTATRLVQPRLVVTLEQVRSDGTAVTLGTAAEWGWFVPTLAPVQRPLLLPFEGPVAFAPGDVLRLHVATAQPAVVGGVAAVPPAALLYTNAWYTPSRVALGDVAPTPPGTAAHCLARHDCVEVGGDKRIEGIDCASAPFRLDWTGPAGSFLALACHGSMHTCTVPHDAAGGWGSCSRIAPVEVLPSNNKASTCSYWTLDGQRADGYGGCYALWPVEDED